MSFQHYLTEQVHSGRDSILVETSIIGKNDRAVRMFANGRKDQFVRHIKTVWQGKFVEMMFKPSTWDGLQHIIKEGKGKYKDDTGIEFEVDKIDNIVVLDSPQLGTLKLSHHAIKEMNESVLFQKPNIPKDAKLSKLPRMPKLNMSLLKSMVSISK
jgi:hypothetical protein